MSEAWKKLAGQVVSGKFHLRQYLGGSEHGAVFLTEHAAAGPQKTAIKLVPADPATAELQLSRWGLAAKLSHPNLIRLFETGRCRLGGKDLLYAVMENAEEDLSQILPQRPLTAAETRDMLGPVLDGLAYLHAKGFVHGHIKPANVMAHADQLKLTTDGLCRMGEPGSGLRHPGPYDPPESTGSRASAAGDVWSFGMTLVEVLTQQLPYWEPTRQADPDVPPAVPAPFQEIARHCLRRDPQLRWTVAEIAARLAPTAPAPAAQPGAQARISARQRKPSAGSRYIVPVLAAAFVLVAIVAVPRIVKRGPDASPKSSSKGEAPRTESQAKSQPKQKPEAPAPEPTAANLPEKKQSPPAAVPPPPAHAPRPIVQAKLPTGDRVRGEVLQQILPDVSEKARDTIRGTVRVGVRISVDSSGNVAETALDSPGPSKYFADLALAAARKWEFAPAKVNGLPVASQWLVRFEFKNKSTNAFPRQTAP